MQAVKVTRSLAMRIWQCCWAVRGAGRRREASAARDLARRSEESGRPERVERTRTVGDWSDLEG